jgi:hypothetical protein
VWESRDESLYTAMQNGLGMNERLEGLELNRVYLTDDTCVFFSPHQQDSQILGGRRATWC